MHLYIDDARDFYHEHAVVCRTGENGILVARGLAKHITVLYMDHDLGPGINGQQVLRRLMGGTDTNLPPRGPFGETLVPEHDPVRPPLVVLITMNPVGYNAMAEILKDYGYEADGVDRYRRKP